MKYDRKRKEEAKKLTWRLPEVSKCKVKGIEITRGKAVGDLVQQDVQVAAISPSMKQDGQCHPGIKL